ncbi:hypothetical protein EJK17_11085 [Lactobacillus xujianguonis]|uniref:Uncharacterized protein n=1 Tax=Lactobacillus xujianguonis TaxID=2495899 RepID=A0A437SSI5_9LACO|nr:hypothetical protein EJK17_11085 [Lactobacillus xujianguonis]RVU71942.1 hypothetical protein EJK20_11175 [Lactobacillus xujianguonis]
MEKFHCPECHSYDVKPIAIGKGPTAFAIIAMRRDGKPESSVQVNLISCSNCGFTWIKPIKDDSKGLNRYLD